MIGKAAELVTKLAALITAGDEQIYELRIYRSPRTLTQNAYYWQLLTQLAGALRISKTELHNRLLRDYGQVMRVGGELVMVCLPDTPDAERKALRSETYHVKPTSQVRADKNGVMRRTYVMLRGSSDYNTKEMSVLVDGLVQEAKQQGIETLTPAELERMRAHAQKLEDRKKRRAA